MILAFYRLRCFAVWIWLFIVYADGRLLQRALHELYEHLFADRYNGPARCSASERPFADNAYSSLAQLKNSIAYDNIGIFSAHDGRTALRADEDLAAAHYAKYLPL
jgi:hypothetical protein